MGLRAAGQNNIFHFFRELTTEKRLITHHIETTWKIIYNTNNWQKQPKLLLFINDHGGMKIYYTGTVQLLTEIDRKPPFNGRIHGFEIKK